MGINRSLINLCVPELESKGFVRIVPRQGSFINTAVHDHLCAVYTFCIEANRGCGQAENVRRRIHAACIPYGGMRRGPAYICALSKI